MSVTFYQGERELVNMSNINAMAFLRAFGFIGEEPEYGGEVSLLTFTARIAANLADINRLRLADNEGDGEGWFQYYHDKAIALLSAVQSGEGPIYWG